METNNSLRRIRLEHNLTQRELAEKANVSRQTINAIERGRITRPSDEIMLAIASCFDLPVERIFFTPLVKHVCQNAKQSN